MSNNGQRYLGKFKGNPKPQPKLLKVSSTRFLISDFRFQNVDVRSIY